MLFKDKDDKIKNNNNLTIIQDLAKFLGWNREKSVTVKITDSEIAPNGTRRERRINNNFLPTEEDDGMIYISKINLLLKNKNFKE